MALHGEQARDELQAVHHPMVDFPRHQVGAREGHTRGEANLELVDHDRGEVLEVFDLLLAVPKYGRVKVNRILTHCRISPSKTIGGLSERQRNELVSYLRR